VKRLLCCVVPAAILATGCAGSGLPLGSSPLANQAAPHTVEAPAAPVEHRLPPVTADQINAVNAHEKADALGAELDRDGE
jgi:hypothetical protein